eukprot:7387289-Prymnesium_polylepis.1
MGTAPRWTSPCRAAPCRDCRAAPLSPPAGALVYPRRQYVCAATEGWACARLRERRCVDIGSACRADVRQRRHRVFLGFLARRHENGVRLRRWEHQAVGCARACLAREVL